MMSRFLVFRGRKVYRTDVLGNITGVYKDKVSIGVSL